MLVVYWALSLYYPVHVHVWAVGLCVWPCWFVYVFPFEVWYVAWHLFSAYAIISEDYYCYRNATRNQKFGSLLDFIANHKLATLYFYSEAKVLQQALHLISLPEEHYNSRQPYLATYSSYQEHIIGVKKGRSGNRPCILLNSRDSGLLDVLLKIELFVGV